MEALHVDATSLRLFRVALNIMNTFSITLLVESLHGLACLKISHLLLKSILKSFSAHTLCVYPYILCVQYMHTFLSTVRSLYNVLRIDVALQVTIKEEMLLFLTQVLCSNNDMVRQVYLVSQHMLHGTCPLHRTYPLHTTRKRWCASLHP